MADKLYVSAAQANNAEIMQYLHENKLSNITSHVPYVTASSGFYDCLKCAVQHGCPLTIQACIGACSYGRLHCLQYLHEQGAPWDESATIIAAQSGHLECLLFAFHYGCPVCDHEFSSEEEQVLQNVGAFFVKHSVDVTNVRKNPKFGGYSGV